MKRLILFILLVASIATFIYAQDARTRAYIHAMLKDSAEVMRGTVSDTADVVRAEADADEDTLYNAIRDTIDVYWSDSAAALRGEFRDTATVLWNDSLPAALGYVSDTADVVRGNAADTSAIYAHDTADVLRAEMIDSARVPLVADWAAGDYDITGLEKLEADTVEGTECLSSNKWFMGLAGIAGTGVISGDALNIEPITYVGTGDADSTIISDSYVDTDSLYGEQVYVKDSLYIPSVAAAPATGTSGLFLADSANDTIVAYIGGTRAIVYPASGAGASAASVHDSCDAVRGEIRDSATVVWVDSAGIILREDGSNALTGNWAAGDYDVTGLEKLEADTIIGTIYGDFVTMNVTEALTCVKVATVDSLDAQHVVGDVHVQTDSLQANHIVLVGDAMLWATYRDTATVVFNDSIAVVTVPRTLVWYYDGNVATGTQFGATYIPEQALTVNDIKLHVETAPVGASLIVDINEAGTTIFSTNPEIDAAATREDDNHVIDDNAIAAGAEVTLDIDQVGSSTAGASLTVILECEQVVTR